MDKEKAEIDTVEQLHDAAAIHHIQEFPVHGLEMTPEELILVSFTPSRRSTQS
jgi:hypothetical protein